MLIYIFIAAVICNMYFVACKYGRISLLKASVLGITNYFFTYILSAALLFSLDKYSVLAATTLTFGLGAVLCVVERLPRGRRPQCYLDKKEGLIFVVICAIALPFSIKNFGYFGMGQDEGVYQTKAIELMEGNAERIYTFEEYDMLETEEQKQEYYDVIKSLSGYNLLDTQPFLCDEFNSYNEVSGIFHGIPTYPAILALFGKMFGLSHMQDCQTLFFVLFLMMLYYLLENFKIKFGMEIVAVLIMGLSPQIIWVSKSALTEMFLAVILTSYMLLLTEREQHMKKYSCLPIIVYAFYHVTIYTIMPMFVVIYWIVYMITKEQKYICVCCVSLLGYALGFIFMLYISPAYTSTNYVYPVANLGFITDQTLVYVVLFAIVIGGLITISLPTVVKMNFFKGISSYIGNYGYILYKLALIVCIFLCFLMCMQKYIVIENFGHITLVAYGIATGVFLLPLAVLKILADLRPKKLEVGWSVVKVAFLYLIFLYSVFLRFEVPYLYYCGRYLVPYMFIIVVVFCIVWNNVAKRKWLWLLFLGSLFYIRPDTNLLKNVDDSRLTWEDAEILVETVADGDAYIIGDNYLVLTLLLKANGADIYFEWDNLEEELNFLESRYGNVYYITTDDVEIDEDLFSLMYKKNAETSEDMQSKLQAYTLYPLEFGDGSMMIELYRNNLIELVYDVKNAADKYAGLSYLEDDYFRWASSDEGEVELICYLEQEDYTVVIEQGPDIPLSDLEMEYYDIDVYINDKYLTKITIDSTNNGKELSFVLPKDKLNKRKNKLEFRYTSWSPEDYGSNDSRKLGFSLKEISFKKSL